jgi:hypothetical protein
MTDDKKKDYLAAGLALAAIFVASFFASLFAHMFLLWVFT